MQSSETQSFKKSICMQLPQFKLPESSQHIYAARRICTASNVGVSCIVVLLWIAHKQHPYLRDGHGQHIETKQAEMEKQPDQCTADTLTKPSNDQNQNGIEWMNSVNDSDDSNDSNLGLILCVDRDGDSMIILADSTTKC